MPPATAAVSLLDRIELLASGDRRTLATVIDMGGSLAVNLLLAGLILAVTLWLSARASTVARRSIGGMTRRHAPDETLQAFVGSLVRYLVIIIGMIAVLQQLGVKTTSVIAVLGAASLAIGLALQGALSNVAAGVMLLLLRPYRVGDQVLVNGQTGVVRSMDLFSTRLTSLEGLEIFVPNGKVFGELLVNYSTPANRRFEWDVGIDYQDDIDLALDLLVKIAEADPRILKAPKPWAKVSGLADSSVTLTLRAWASTADWGDAKHDTLKTIKETFEANGLNFPFPQQTASVREAKPEPAKAPGPSLPRPRSKPAAAPRKASEASTSRNAKRDRAG